VIRRHVRKEVEMCGDCWTTESVLIFIYTPVISLSLASKPSTQNRPILLAIIIFSPTVAHLVPYLLLFCLVLGRTLPTRALTVNCIPCFPPPTIRTNQWTIRVIRHGINSFWAWLS